MSSCRQQENRELSSGAEERCRSTPDYPWYSCSELQCPSVRTYGICICISSCPRCLLNGDFQDHQGANLNHLEDTWEQANPSKKDQI